MKALLILTLFFQFSSSAAKLGNRYFIANKLENVFGPNVKEYVIKNILKNGDTFSGPCDPYKFYKNSKGSHNRADDCFAGLHESKLQYWAKESPVRIVLMKKACSEISKDPHILNYVNGKKGNLSYASYIINGLTPFMSKSSKNRIISKLKKNTKPQQVIYRLCKSPFWQYI